MAHRQDVLEGDALLPGSQLGSPQRRSQYREQERDQTTTNRLHSSNNKSPAMSSPCKLSSTKCMTQELMANLQSVPKLSHTGKDSQRCPKQLECSLEDGLLIASVASEWRLHHCIHFIR